MNKSHFTYHIGTVPICNFNFNSILESLSIRTKDILARNKLNPQVRLDGTTGKYCLTKTQAQSVVAPLAFFLLAETIQEKWRQEPTNYRNITKQAVEPGGPGHLTGMRRPISSVQAACWRKE